jgi:NDP-sugar pyrophosphorylase family protein
MPITQNMSVVPRRLEDSPSGLRDVTAAILAGGLGTRLRAVVPDRPKVLALVHGRPYISYLLDRLAEAGIRRTVLLTGYRAEDIERALGERHGDMRLVHSKEPTALGTGGALRHGLAGFSSSLILLLNGDSWCNVDLAGFFAFHRRAGADLSMVAAQTDDPARYGMLQIGDTGRVEHFDEKQAGTEGWINAGIYLLRRGLIESIAADMPFSLERDLLPQWLTYKQVFAYRHHGRFLDIGTPEAYAAAELLIPPRGKR